MYCYLRSRYATTRYAYIIEISIVPKLTRHSPSVLGIGKMESAVGVLFFLRRYTYVLRIRIRVRI